ncbi:SPOR domain-containing protein [Poseidonibacter lekithochrous]|uniref:SPOR domain-containing protein n=1 Tax=Poseidonibacter lekithochrous TaxID=1904463 RepID=UPI0008FCA835|nr:SPOR domain-containing protein [Poseidonibacter lekithochrous]QKJ22591.1 SPOR domain-containing protein [Poseidonibacter lekithochrous]
MIKIVTSTLFLSSILMTANAANNYTYVFTSTSNIDNAKSFINTHLQHNTQDIYIIKHKDRYRVSYGAFDNRSEAKYFKRNLPFKIKKLDKFLVKNTFDLTSESSKIIEVIKSKNPVIIKKEKKVEYKKKVVKAKSISSSMNNYSFVFFNTSKISNGKKFVKNFMSKANEDIYFVKHKNNYRVSYGAFSSKKEALAFERTLPKHIKKLDKFLVKNSFDLPSNDTKVAYVIRVKPKATVQSNEPEFETRIVQSTNILKEPIIKKPVVKEKVVKKTVVVKSKKPVLVKNKKAPVKVKKVKPVFSAQSKKIPTITKREVVKAPAKKVAKKVIVKPKLIKKPVSKPVKKVVKKTIKKAITPIKIDNRFKNYTYVFSSMSNLKNAKAFASRHLKDHKENIYIVKHNKRYRVSYGAFANRKEAYAFKKSLPLNIKKMDNFLVKNGFDLNKDKKNVIEIIRTKEEQELMKRILLEQKKKSVLLAKKDDKKTIKTVKPVKAIETKEKKKEDKKPKKKSTKEEKAVLTRENKSKITFGMDSKVAALDVDNDFVYGQGGTNFSLKSKSTTLIPKVFLNYGEHTILASYLGMEADGSSTLASDLTFGGTTFSAGDSISSSYKTDWFTTGYRYKYKDMNLGVDIHDYSNKFNINGSEVTRDFLFPALAIDMKKNFKKKYNVLYGASIGLNSEMSYYDYYLGFGIKDLILPTSNLSIGYKSQNFDINDNTYDGKTSYNSGYFNFKKEF